MWFCIEKAEGPKGSIKPDASVVQKAFCVQCQLAVRAVHFDQAFQGQTETLWWPGLTSTGFQTFAPFAVINGEVLQQSSPRSVQEGPLAGQDLVPGAV